MSKRITWRKIYIKCLCFLLTCFYVNDIEKWNFAGTNAFTGIAFGGGGAGGSVGQRDYSNAMKSGGWGYAPSVSSSTTAPLPSYTARDVGNAAGTVGLYLSRNSPAGIATTVVGLIANNWD